MNDKILDKIRKLRALATSANLNEAAAAASAAERLIQEHNLSEAALHVESEEEGVSSEGLAEDMGSVIPTWRGNLLAHLSNAYQCSGFYERVYHDGGKVSFRFKVYGRPSDLGTLRYQDAFFSSEIARLTVAASRGKGRTYANSFRLGAVSAIAEALGNVRRSVRAAATSTALAVVDQRIEMAKKKLRQDHPNLRNSGGGASRLDGAGYAAGKQAGAGISQRSQLGASGARLLGSGS